MESTKGPSSPSREHNQGRQTRQFTKEQAEAVNRIRKCGIYEYYEILGVSREATEPEIKRAYRKVALQMHPDKNGAPGADEAFKMVSKAFQVLNDPQKRTIYDHSGRDPDARVGGPSASHFGGFSNGFPNGAVSVEEITPEELFNMFFGADLGGGVFQSATFVTPDFRARRFTSRRASPNGEDPQPTSPYITLIQLFPLFFLVLLSLITNIFVPVSETPPAFSLREIPPYTHHRYTQSLHVGYFVDADSFTAFEQNPRKLRNFESSVEATYVNNLNQACMAEKTQRNRNMRSAQGWFRTDEQKLNEARAMPMPNCDEISELTRKYGKWIKVLQG